MHIGRLVFAFAAVVAPFGSGCVSPLGGGVRAYEQGRYAEAMDEFRAIEGAVERWDAADVARYELYRGLAHLALGDIRAAHDWFGRVERAINAESGLLSPEDTYRLASARAHLPR